MLQPPGCYYVKKPKRFVILSSDKSSERNLSCFFDIKNPRRLEHLQREEPFSSDPYFSNQKQDFWPKINILKGNHCILRILGAPVSQKLDMILENKVVQKLKLEK